MNRTKADLLAGKHRQKRLVRIRKCEHGFAIDIICCGMSFVIEDFNDLPELNRHRGSDLLRYGETWALVSMWNLEDTTWVLTQLSQ